VPNSRDNGNVTLHSIMRRTRTTGAQVTAAILATMSLLSDSESSSDEKKGNVRLKINEKFADRFERQERVKDLHRAKELLKHADQDDEESDSESETEDEDAEQLSTGLDLKIIQTINMLRKKDPKIYDSSTKWFNNPTDDESSGDEDTDKKQQTKKKKFKDVIREQLLESSAAGGLGDGDGIEVVERRVRDTASKNTLVYDAEQENIRQAFLKSASSLTGNGGKAQKRPVGSDSSDEEDVFKVRQKSAKELQEEEIELQRALKEMRELAAKAEKRDEAKAAKQQNKTKVLEIDNADGFLETYLEKRMWEDKGNGRKVATSAADDAEDDDEDEEELEEMERFESKYNFRFEELQDQKNAGGAVEVMGHARDVQGSMRRVDDKRKTQREGRKERKEKERRQQEAELRRLKNLKRQEVGSTFLPFAAWPPLIAQSRLSC
jgi:protein KRI1